MTAALAVWLSVGLVVYALALRGDWTLVKHAAHWHAQGRKHPRRDFLKGAAYNLHAIATWPLIALWLLLKELR